MTYAYKRANTIANDYIRRPAPATSPITRFDPNTRNRTPAAQATVNIKTKRSPFQPIFSLQLPTRIITGISSILRR